MSMPSQWPTAGRKIKELRGFLRWCIAPTSSPLYIYPRPRTTTSWPKWGRRWSFPIRKFWIPCSAVTATFALARSTGDEYSAKHHGLGPFTDDVHKLFRILDPLSLITVMITQPISTRAFHERLLLSPAPPLTAPGGRQQQSYFEYHCCLPP